MRTPFVLLLAAVLIAAAFSSWPFSGDRSEPSRELDAAAPNTSSISKAQPNLSSSATSSVPIEMPKHSSTFVGMFSPIVNWLDRGTLEIALIVIAAIVFGICLLLLKRRRDLLLTSPHLVTPADFGSWTSRVDKGLQTTLRYSIDSREALSGFESRIGAAFQEMSQTFLTLQGALDAKDKELARAKAGWDATIYRKFLLRFVKVNRLLSASNQRMPDQELLRQVKILLNDALLECGVEKYEPQVGADYKTTKGVDENPELIPNADPESHFKIASVVSDGYVLRHSEESLEVILPAKVKVFSPTESSHG